MSGRVKVGFLGETWPLSLCGDCLRQWSERLRLIQQRTCTEWWLYALRIPPIFVQRNIMSPPGRLSLASSALVPQHAVCQAVLAPGEQALRLGILKLLAMPFAVVPHFHYSSEASWGDGCKGPAPTPSTSYGLQCWWPQAEMGRKCARAQASPSPYQPFSETSSSLTDCWKPPLNKQFPFPTMIMRKEKASFYVILAESHVASLHLAVGIPVVTKVTPARRLEAGVEELHLLTAQKARNPVNEVLPRK